MQHELQFMNFRAPFEIYDSMASGLTINYPVILELCSANEDKGRF